MRKILTLAAVLALAGCGGGGGGASAPSNPVSPTTAPTTTPLSDYVTPQFTLVIPQGKSSTGKSPQYISPSTLSVKITLNNPPAGVTNPSVVTNVNGTGVACSSGCTVSGPPSPPGTDSFTVTTYDAVNAGGNALSTATKSFTIVAGSPNTGLTIVLNGIVVKITITNVPSATANTPKTQALTVSALDADNNVITGTYGDSTGAANPVTVTTNDTDPNGVTLTAGGGATQNNTHSVTLHNNTETVTMNYGGVAENVTTLSAAASGATNTPVNFQPALLPITPSTGTEIDLYVPGDVGGTGASGSQTFSELGFTNAPYSKSFSTTFTMTSGYTTACANIATFTQATPGVLAVTAATTANTPTAGSCDLTVSDGLTQSGHVSTATVKVTYTTSSVSGSSKHRKQ